MFKPGDIVICTKKSEVSSLTLGKRYHVIDVLKRDMSDRIEGVKIENDLGSVGFFYPYFFTTLKELRKNKVKKILL